MRIRKLNQLGFGITELLIVGVVLVVVIAGGAIFYKHNKDSTKDNAATASQPSTQNTESNNAQSAQSAQKYVTIKEWGVKMPLTDPIADAYYVVSSSTKDENGQPNTVWLGLASLNDKGCDANMANQGKSTQLGSFMRVSPSDVDPVSGESYKEKYPNGTTIGSYYYAYKSWTNGKTCTSQANLNSINSAFADSIKATTSTQ